MKRLELTFTGWQRVSYADQSEGHVTANLESMKLYQSMIAAGDCPWSEQVRMVETCQRTFRKQLMALRDELNTIDFFDSEVPA